MKKILSVLLVAIMALSLCACGKKKEGNAGTTKNTSSKVKTESGVEVEVLTCAFDNEIMGYDEEASGYGYGKREGRVYINLTLKIKNDGEEIFTKDKLSASCELDGVKRDLQYNFLTAAPQSDNNNVLPGCIALINFLTTVEESDMNKDLTVKYVVDGKEYEKKVGKLVEADALSAKTEVKVGEKIEVEDFYEIKVLDCSEKSTIVITNEENNKEYRPMGKDKKFVDITVEFKNNTDVEFNSNHIKCYVVPEDGQGLLGRFEYEDKENCMLSNKSVKPGEEVIAHLYVGIDDTMNTDGMAVRFSLAGNCYYTYVKNA